jgi:hypothetical protein
VRSLPHAHRLPDAHNPRAHPELLHFGLLQICLRALRLSVLLIGSAGPGIRVRAHCVAGWGVEGAGEALWGVIWPAEGGF